MKIRLIVPLFFAASLARAQFQFNHDPSVQTWSLSNRLVRAEFQLSPDGVFTFEGLTNLRTGRRWGPPADHRSSPIDLVVSGTRVGASSHFRLISQSAQAIPRQGYRQTIVLQEAITLGQVTLELEMFANHPVLRYRVLYRNVSGGSQRVRHAGLLPWTFDTLGRTYRLFRVKQWVDGGRKGNFDPEESDLAANVAPAVIDTGAHGTYCTWLAIRSDRDAGIFAGWEFDGRVRATVTRTADPSAIQLTAPILELDRTLQNGQTFAVPAAFLGLFRGDWDEAGYRTQRFVEAAIAKPIPDQNFPYVVWDSWGYQYDFDEDVLRRNAEIAARIGIEVFVIDLGWARNIGDWHPDPRKFPSGIRALSDYVHSLGMKFGIHFPLAEAAPQAPMLMANPDWRSSSTYGYFGADSLCLSHRPVREWVLREALRIIDEYNVDWILQDGENMVKHCNKTTHTHASTDSNYSNAVDGLNWIVEAAQEQRPRVHWENCEDGGNMMTYNMVRNYVTSIAADDSGEITTRQAIHGITYPFSPRYADRYMPHDEFDSYITRSYMFGGPWIWMNHLPEVEEFRLRIAEQEIRIFKELRARLRSGKVLHLTGPATATAIDAIASHHLPTDSVTAFVYRHEAPESAFTLRINALTGSRMYRVRFQNDSRVLTLRGDEVAGGVHVPLPHEWYAEIVYIEPAPPGQ